jgi:hypothetical protein
MCSVPEKPPVDNLHRRFPRPCPPAPRRKPIVATSHKTLYLAEDSPPASESSPPQPLSNQGEREYCLGWPDLTRLGPTWPDLALPPLSMCVAP